MSRNACSGENGEKSPASGNLNCMPKVAPWRLAILAKLTILAKIARGLAIMAINVPGPWRLAILAKNRQPFSPMRAFLDISLKSGRSLLRNLVVVTYKTVGRLYEVVNFEKGSLCDCDVDML